MTPTHTYSATAFANHLPEGRANGRLSVDQHDFTFHGEGLPPVRLPLNGLDLRFGGFNNQQAFLSHASVPGWTILCTDQELLKDDALAFHPVYGKAASKVRRRSKKWPWPVKAALWLTVLFIAAIIWVWSKRAAITESLAESVPVSVEQQIGEAVYQQVKATAKESQDPAHKAMVDAVTKRLLPAITGKRYEFTFHIVENDAINAFAIPGGHVVIHTALLKAAKRPEELAGVLAHEIAHVTRRHSLRNMIGSAGTWIVVQAMLGDMSVLAEASSSLLGQKFSRDFEREADDTGWDYLMAAKIDPRGLTEFFRTLSKEEEKTGLKMEGALNLLSTHPATAERIAALEQKWNALPPGTVFEPIQ